MAGRSIYRVVILIILAALIACAGIDEGVIEEETAASAYLEITSPYDEQSILLPVVQLNYFRMSTDYFGQFAWEDDYIFPDYIFKIFGFKSSPYEEGQGTILSSPSPDDEEVYFRLEKSLLEKTPGGGQWWQINQITESGQIFYEVLISAEKIPQIIRYVHPDTGEKHEHIPLIAEKFERALEEVPIEELRERIKEEWEEGINQQLGLIFNKPEILGEEMVKIEAGAFMAVHIRDLFIDETATQVDYWISPDVPGNILKIVYISPDHEGVYVTELIRITRGNSSEIEESEIIAKGDFGGEVLSPEGSPQTPVQLMIGAPTARPWDPAALTTIKRWSGRGPTSEYTQRIFLNIRPSSGLKQ